ncbi:MAG: hypothetical protein DRI46_11590, partial [Chloroflexi bacterium]
APTEAVDEARQLLSNLDQAPNEQLQADYNAFVVQYGEAAGQLNVDTLDGIVTRIAADPDTYGPGALARANEMLDRVMDDGMTTLRLADEAEESRLGAFVELGESIGDDMGEIQLTDLPRYIENVEIAHAEGRLEDVIDDPEGFIGNLHDLLPDSGWTPTSSYTFGENTFRNYSLPDTDDASYTVTIYKNDAVDKKGLTYHDTHFGKDAEGYVFHSRTDSPEPGVHRIQELQSDLQNELTKEKGRAIKDWQKPASEAPTVHDIMNVTINAEGPIETMRTGINTSIIDEINTNLGVAIDPAASFGQSVGSLTVNDIRSNMVNGPLTGNTFVHNMSDQAHEFLGNLMDGGERTFIEPSGEVYDEVLKASGLKPAKFDELLDTIKNLEDKYFKKTRDLVTDNIEAAEAKAANRVTPKERVKRIMSGSSIPEEQELYRRAVLEEERVNAHLSPTAPSDISLMDIIADMAKDLPPLEKFPDQAKFALDIPYVKQGLQNEIVAAIKSGKKEVWLTMDPKGTDKLLRGKGPHSSYMPGGKHYKQFKSLATRFKAAIKEEDGYLKIILPAAGATALAVPAYAEPNNQDFRSSAFDQGFRPGEVDSYIKENPLEEQEQPLWAEQAINEGYTDEQITQYQFEEWVKLLSPEKISQTEMVIESDVPTVNGDPVYQKLSTERIQELALELKVNPYVPSGIDAIYAKVLQDSNPAAYNAAYMKEEDEVKQDMADLIELYDVDRPFLWARSKLGFPDAVATYERLQDEARANVVALGKDKGYELRIGDGIPESDGGSGLAADEWFVNNGSGQWQLATPTFMQTMARYYGETTGGIAGTAAGVKTAGKFGQTVDPLLQQYPGGRAFSLLAKFGIITAYTAAGAMLGDEIDYTSAAVRQDEDITWQMASDKALGAAQMSVVADVLAVPIAKVGSFGWRKVSHAYKELANGNINAAYDMLKDVTGLSDDQIVEIIERWKKLNDVQGPITIKTESRILGDKTQLLSPKEEALAVVPITKAGGENIVASAGHIDPRASVITARQVSKRADDMIAEVKGRVAAATGDDDLVIATQKNLDEYMNTEKTFYDQTRTSGSDLVAPGYQFNLNTIAIKPLFDSVTTTISKKGKAEQAIYTLERAKTLVKSRTFDDLIELRQLMNDFRGGNKLKKRDIEAFKEVMASIDDEIEQVMARSPGGQEWMKQWDEARSRYGTMKDVTTSVLAKAVFKKGTNPKDLARAFVKYGVASDGTYSDLMKQLDHKNWKQIENNIIEVVTDKHTVGLEGEFRAIQFPELDKQLSQYDFLTNEAKELQQAAARLAEVYTNDVHLSYISGGIKLSPPQQGLTADLSQKAKYSFMAKVWNNVSRYLGTKDANTAAMVRKVADFLENPLDSAT